MIDDSQIDVYYAPLSPISCEIWVRLRDVPAGEQWTIAGQVRGPECCTSRMLPATNLLRCVSSGGEPRASALVPDPCFWSPELPAFYRIKIDVSRNGKLAGSFDRTLGIRPLAVRGRNLYWDSRRFVLRAVACESSIESDIAAWRESGAAMVVDCPDDSLCRAATEDGVLLAVRLRGDAELLAKSRRVARWGAVAFIFTEGEVSMKVVNSSPNLLFVESRCEGDSPSQLPIEAVEIQTLETGPSQVKPAIAIRRLPAATDVATARSECDRLQRDLAPCGDWAGYVV
jgi:hypothetical protein